jgi:hypothetical protein
MMPSKAHLVMRSVAPKNTSILSNIIPQALTIYRPSCKELRYHLGIQRQEKQEAY